MVLEAVPCPQCANEQFDHVATRVDNLRIVRCRTCNLAHLNPRPTAQEIIRLYSADYYLGGSDEGLGYAAYCDRPSFMRSCSPFGWELLRDLTPLAGARALDVGCARGHMVWWLQRAGAKATGIDLSPEAVTWGRQSLGLDLRVSSLEALNDRDRTFDVITMLDLIEHVVDLDAFMRRLASLLKPGGMAFVQTPNFACYPTWGDRCRYLRFSLEHLLYFDTHTLDALFAKYDMCPMRPTRVYITIPCDTDSYIDTRTRDSAAWKRWVRRLPAIDCIRVLRARLRGRSRSYTIDESERQGATIVGCYERT